MAIPTPTTNLGIVTPFDPPPEGCEWRLVPLNDHYEVSEYGHLRRAVGGSNSRKGKLILPRLNGVGYVRYGLWRDNKTKHVHAHRLVALAFIPNPNNLPQVAHWDGSHSHCAVSNLRWATGKENSADRIRHGRQARGEQVNGKLTEDQVRAIRVASGAQRDIARRFGITQAAVWRIKNGVTWRHLWTDSDCPRDLDKAAEANWKASPHRIKYELEQENAG